MVVKYVTHNKLCININTLEMKNCTGDIELRIGY
jgi:hypothetical protein